MEEDSGQLLESDVDSSQSHTSSSVDPPPPSQSSSSHHNHRHHHHGHSHHNQGGGGGGGHMLKNGRSLSLPASYLPHIRFLQQQQQQLQQQQQRDKDSLNKSGGGRGGAHGQRGGHGHGPSGVSGGGHHKELQHHNSDQLDSSIQEEQSDQSHPSSSGGGGGSGGIGSLGGLKGVGHRQLTGATMSGGSGSAMSGGSGSKREQDSDSKKRSEWRTLQQHYYPEGGWGWVVCLCALLSHALALGTQLYLSNIVFHHFQQGWLGAMSMGISLFLSPIWVSICKRKSTRLAAVFGGLIASLGCLFTSFASQYHQLFLSYGAFLGVGVGLTRDASSLMVGQYFKRRREIVEIIVVSGSGLGILLMSIFIHVAISSLGWRLGLQAVTGSLFLTFFLGTCYRSASLYHPQRRAILHLKNQKRKVKDKEKREDKPPFMDFGCLRSKTLQILLLASALTASGVNTPLFYLVSECRENRVEDFSIIVLHIYVGAGWMLGCSSFGLLAVQKNQECRVSKQYLCQVASLICGMSILAVTIVKGFNGLVIFTWVYGFSLGGYNYALKVYTYERVRARHFPRAWSFIQCSQAIPLILGVPFTGYINTRVGFKAGYYFSALTVILGSTVLFLTDVRRRRLSRRKTQNSSVKTCETLESAQSPKLRRLSFAFPAEQLSPNSKHDSTGGTHEDIDEDGLDPVNNMLKELTCISEEGLADIDFQDIYFEEWEEYFGADCITSCNKVENCLSEYDPDYPAALLEPRRVRRWSAARPTLAQAAHAGIGATAAAVASGVAGLGAAQQQHGQQQHLTVVHPQRLLPPSLAGGLTLGVGVEGGPSTRDMPIFRHAPHHLHHPPHGVRRPSQPRTISIIDEASI